MKRFPLSKSILLIQYHHNMYLKLQSGFYSSNENLITTVGKKLIASRNQEILISVFSECLNQ